jgi:pyrimidine-nucleoside phosphorylase
MNVAEIIRKKRDGNALTQEEITHLIHGYSRGEIPDYQLSAWAMTVYFQGMTPEETAYLTLAMAESGEQMDLTSISGIKVDKHSTGGVGDKTTLILAPLVAAAGVKVAKLSGRGLGFTGGTIDKLESIAGFSTELTVERFVQLVNQSGLAVMGQTSDLTPADKQLYGLRDVTATVDSIPLIASSIMSKKLATGSDAIVLDVKTGAGAFMKSEEDSIRLAEAMVEIGTQVGRKTVALITDMSQPLGYAVGNALEVKEAMETLQGKGPSDLTELSLALGAQMLVLAEKTSNENEAKQILRNCMEDGSAVQKFKEFITNQQGDASVADDYHKLPQASEQIAIVAENNGFVQAIEADEVGLSAMLLGAGRAKKGDVIDHAVGLVLHKKIGDRVEAGDQLVTMHVNNKQNLPEVEQKLKSAIRLSDQPVEVPVLLRKTIS